MQKIGRGYANAAVGFLANLLGSRKPNLTTPDNGTYLDIMLREANEQVGDEFLAVHIVNISETIGESIDSPQYIFTRYAADNKIDNADQLIMAKYFRDRNLDVWSVAEHNEISDDISRIAADMNTQNNSTYTSEYAVYQAPDPYFVLEHRRTRQAWVIDTSHGLPAYVGAAYPSATEALTHAQSITSHTRISSMILAVVPTIFENNGSLVIGIDDSEYYLMNGGQIPPAFSDIHGNSPERLYAMVTDARVAMQKMAAQGFIPGTTRIKVIYRGKTAMGTIVAGRSHTTPSGIVKEYRVELDPIGKADKKIIWVRDTNVVRIYNGSTKQASDDMVSPVLSTRVAQMDIPPIPEGDGIPPPPPGGGAAVMEKANNPLSDKPPVDDPLSDKPEAGSDDRMSEIVDGVGDLEGKIQDVAKSMFMIDLKPESLDQVVQKTVDLISTQVATDTSKTVMEAVNPSGSGEKE